MRTLFLALAGSAVLAFTVACSIKSTEPDFGDSTNPTMPDQSKLPPASASELGADCSGFGTSPGDTVAFTDAECAAGICLVDARGGLDLYCSVDCSKNSCPTGYTCQATTLGEVSFACFKNPGTSSSSSSSSSSGSTSSSGGSSSSSSSGGSSSGGSSSGGSSSGSSSSSGGTGDAVCAAKADNADCSTCCDTNHPTGSNTFEDAFANCVCQTSVCGTPCSAECAGTATTIGAACNTCLDATTTTTACQGPVSTACNGDPDCVSWSSCENSCPAN